MTEQGVILNRLLDKYENSKHLSEPGTSTRRVMLRVGKKELPEYIYEDAAIRDSYNEAALELEKQHLVQLEWVKARPVLSTVILRLDRIMPCYAAAERVHPRVRAKQVTDAVRIGLDGVAVPWIAAWREDICKSADEQMNRVVFGYRRLPERIAGRPRFARCTSWLCCTVWQHNHAGLQQQVFF